MRRLAVFLLALAPAAAQAVPVRGEWLDSAAGLRVLRVWGDDAEQGFAEGHLLGGEILDLLREFALGRAVANPWVWQHVVRPAVRAKVTGWPQWALARMRGLLAGMASRGDGALFVAELGRDLDLLDLMAGAALPDLVGFACSSLAVPDAPSAGGVMVGRNLDYFATPALCRLQLLVVHASADGRARWASLRWPGLVGSATACSADGLFLAVHDVPVRTPTARGITPRLVALEDAVRGGVPDREPATALAARLRGFRFGMGGNVLCAWPATAAGASGACVIELDSGDADGGVTVRLPGDGAAHIACSNHFRRRAAERPCRRYQRLCEQAVRPGDWDAGRMHAALQRAAVRLTVQQVVFDGARRALSVRLRPAPDRPLAAAVWLQLAGLWRHPAPGDAGAPDSGR